MNISETLRLSSPADTNPGKLPVSTAGSANAGACQQERQSPSGVAASAPPRGWPPQNKVDRLSGLPPELLDMIVFHLHGADVKAMMGCSRGIGASITSHADRARVTHEASQVTTLVGFKTVLALIGRLRQNLQATPLFQLGRRVHALVPDETSQVEALFQAAVSALPDSHRTPELSSLAQVVAYARLEDAVHAGGNVQMAAQAWNITTPENIRWLEDIAIYGGAAVSPGSVGDDWAKLEDIARDRGITTPAGVAAFRDFHQQRISWFQDSEKKEAAKKKAAAEKKLAA